MCVCVCVCVCQCVCVSECVSVCVSVCLFVYLFVCLSVVIPLCGGNTDTTVLGRCLERGLAADGRLCRFLVTVSDRPGGIAELTKLLAGIGVRCGRRGGRRGGGGGGRD